MLPKLKQKNKEIMRKSEVGVVTTKGYGRTPIKIEVRSQESGEQDFYLFVVY
ncbi:MAG: hypothetical protein Fur006_57810 [Coleofasciculaceae cyanobacterium]